MPIPQQIDKPYASEEFRTCDFAGILGTDLISTADVTITDSAGVDVTATMISDVSIPLGSKSVRYKLIGGEVGFNYTLTIIVDTVGTQKFPETFTVCVF